MQRIVREGGEASYHFEELSTLAKNRGVTDPEAINALLPEIRGAFLSNVSFVRSATSLPVEIVAAHGDWMNRRLKIPNTVVTDDPVTRQKAQVHREVYDTEFAGAATCNLADEVFPIFWTQDPFEAVYRDEELIYVLLHPRNWRRAVWENLVDNVLRLKEVLVLSARSRRS